MSSLTDPEGSPQTNRLDEDQNIQDDMEMAPDYLPAKFHHLKSIFKRASDGIFLIDLTGVLVDGNRVAAKLTGYEREELLGGNIFELNLLPQESMVLAAELLEKSIHGESVGPEFLILNRKDGTTIPVEVFIYPLHYNNRSLVLGVVKNTRAEQYEKRLDENEERFRTIFFDSPIGIAIFDADLMLQHTNHAWVELFGVGSQFTTPNIGLLDDMWVSDEIKEKIKNCELVRFETVFDFGTFKRRGVGKTGTVHLDFQVSPFGLGNENNANGFLVHAQDITTRKTAEEMLRKAHDHLEREVAKRTAHLCETNEALEILLNERKKRAAALGETNTALKILLNERQMEKKNFKETMLHNLLELVMPFLQQLKASDLSDDQQRLTEVLEGTLQDVLDPLIKESPLDKLPITRTELQVAKLIQSKYTSAEIARIFDTSLRTIEQHRYNLRKKLGLTNKKQNLRSYLLMMNEGDGELESDD